MSFLNAHTSALYGQSPDSFRPRNGETRAKQPTPSVDGKPCIGFWLWFPVLFHPAALGGTGTEGVSPLQ
jgi:hypothetical protein